MSIFDINSNYEFIKNKSFLITVNETTFGDPFLIDESHGGFTCSAFLFTAALTGTPTITFTLQESADSSDWIDIPDSKLISSTGATTFVIDADQLPPVDMLLIGAFSTDKFIRVKVVSIGIVAPTIIDFNVWRKIDTPPQTRII